MQPGAIRFFVLFPVALFLMVTSAYPIAVLCFVLLTAQHWAEGDRQKAWGVALLAGAAGGILLGSPQVALGLTLLVASGIPLAVLKQRGWSYGLRLVAASSVASAAMAVLMVTHWSAFRRDMTVMINARIAEGPAGVAANDQMVELLKWCDLNLAYVLFGFLFGWTLLMSAFLLCVLDRWQKSPEAVAKRKPSGFQRMRLPDWLVWVAIAVALLWFAEDRWHNEVLRLVTWNAAIGLSFVYWLNGVSILLYALSIFKASAFAMFMVFSAFFLLTSLLPMLGVFGLFDTWYNFRMRFRRLALLRRLSYRDGDS